MLKILRPLLMLLAALPLLMGVVTASFAEAPCPYGHNGGTDRSPCPCCDKLILAAAVPCLQCQSAIESATAGWLPRLDATRISFAPFNQRAGGLSIEPPLPPPRSMGLS